MDSIVIIYTSLVVLFIAGMICNIIKDCKKK
nr:MAG TPA: hypothetical protein [Bacteriophage sp.]